MRITLAVLPVLSVVASSGLAEPNTVTTTTTLTAANPATSAVQSKAMSLSVPNGPVLKTTRHDSGLLIEELKFGNGHEIKADEAFTANYHCTLKADGTAFDSSYDPVFKHQWPATFSPSRVIQGWDWGMQGMKVGGIRRLTIPASLGYKEVGVEPIIPPNADLVFTIELTGVLQIEETKVGDGEVITDQSVAVTTYTMKDANGKVIDKADAARPYIWLPGEFAPIQYGLEGMKIGGKRTLIVPSDMNTLPGDSTSTRPPNTQHVPISIEVELVGARRLPPPQMLGVGC